MLHDEDKTSTVSRRAVIASAALVPVAAIRSAAQLTSPTETVFTASERRLLEAFLGRLIPKDENGPGALECGAVGYFERQLAGYLAPEKPAILAGLTSADAIAHKKHEAGFADLPADQQDAVITEVQETNTAFFNRFRRLTLEATFGDPYYGGNKDFAGWDLIRYPGVRLAVSADEQRMAPVKPVHVSAWGAKHGQ